MVMKIHLFANVVAARLLLALVGCSGVGQKTYDGGAYQQIFFGGQVVRQADFPTPAMCSAGMRTSRTPPQDVVLKCTTNSLSAELPYTGRVVNAGWGLDAPIHYRAKEACLVEAAGVPAEVKIHCP